MTNQSNSICPRSYHWGAKNKKTKTKPNVINIKKYVWNLVIKCIDTISTVKICAVWNTFRLMYSLFACRNMLLMCLWTMNCHKLEVSEITKHPTVRWMVPQIILSKKKNRKKKLSNDMKSIMTIHYNVNYILCLFSFHSVMFISSIKKQW